MTGRFKLLIFLAAIALTLISTNAMANVELVGVKIKVPDVAEAKKFYLDTLGFRVESESENGKTIWLKTNSYRVVLEQSKDARRISSAGYSDVSMSMRVNDIDETFRRLKAAGVRFIKDEKRKEGVGWSLQILDPFGNKISMMQITVGKPETIVEPSVYNCGLYVSDIEKALSTYQDAFGFVVRSRNYMPEDMPLGYADKRFAFMLHLRRADFAYVENPNMMLIFETGSPASIESLKKSGGRATKIAKDRFVITDSVGIRSELIIQDIKN